jgi:hypothetical protein
MTDQPEQRCRWCRHSVDQWHPATNGLYCQRKARSVWVNEAEKCADYEREPGADDE